jgi:amino acid adenylation domain-containing protein
MVGLFAGRSIEMIVGVLGIVRAGGAYVPMDPEYPIERLSFMMRDARISALVTHTRLAGALPDIACPVIALDAIEPAAVHGQELPVLPVPATAPAYVIYTSGSTGTPKGVVVTHRAVARTVCGADYVQVAPSDRVAHASNVSFDAATFEIWGALLNGGALVILPRDVLLEPSRLEAAVRTYRISILFVTTAVVNQVAAVAPSAFSSLRCLLFGGEAVDPSAVRRILTLGAPARCVHVYGPTESTTFASWHLVETVTEDATTIPIGRPLSNTELYVLDEQWRPVPVGFVGELCIGGDGLARGYLNDPGRTAERFAPNPFGPPGSRLYRSGDLVRLLPGGLVAFVGRRDGQVKIRGHRIELGEVEALIREYSAVHDVVALCREDVPGDKRLVAYVAFRQQPPVDLAELRAHLARRAPGDMMPSAVVALPELPLTPNGKVDRAALLAIVPDTGDAAQDGGPPRTPTEAVIARLFAAVLRRDEVGASGHFFELGGHSLLAAQVVSLVREQCRVELPLRAIFSSPTVSALAAVIDDFRKQGAPAPGPAIAPVERERYRVRRSPTGELEIPDALWPLLHVSHT